MKKQTLKYLIFIIGIFFSCNLLVFAKDTELKIHAIECKVQGDSTLLESNGKYLLMDTCMNEEKNQVLAYLDNNKVTAFDIYLSHWHPDHYGKIMDILNNDKYTISTIYLPTYNKDESLYKQITDKAKEKNITVKELQKGSEFDFQDAHFSIIGPISGTENLDNKVNNNSLVAKIKVGNTIFLTTGDIEKEQEELLVKNKVDLKADILKLSHHGLDSGNTLDFIKQVKPTFSFYHMYGEDVEKDLWGNKLNANVINKMLNLSNILSTAYNGNLLYTIKNDSISVKATRNYLEATLHYIDYDTKKEFKSEVYPFNAKTYFILPNLELPDYIYYGYDGYSFKPLDKKQDISVYYAKKVVETPKESSNKEESTSEKTDTTKTETKEETNEEAKTSYKCQEKDGKYYDKNGNSVTKETYYKSCGVVENPKTGSVLSLLTIVILGILVVLTAIIKKKFNKSL